MKNLFNHLCNGRKQLTIFTESGKDCSKKKRKEERKKGRISRDISSNRRIYHRTATSRACFFGTDNSLRNCRPLNRPFPPVSPRRWTHKEGGGAPLLSRKKRKPQEDAQTEKEIREIRGGLPLRRRILPPRQIKIRSNGRTRKNKRARERERERETRHRGGELPEDVARG